MDGLGIKVIEENIRLHAEQARVYRCLNPQLYNFHNSKRLYCETGYIMDILESGKEISVLDLGCGTGLLSSYFLKNKNCKITAVDLSAEMLDIFRENTSKKDNLQLVKCEAMGFMFKSVNEGVKYNAVVMSALLHHLVNIDEFIKVACKLVDTGGILYIAFEPLKQEIKSKVRYIGHKIIRTLDEAGFHLYLKAKNIEPESKGMADYQLVFGGVEPLTLIDNFNRDEFRVISLNRFCVRRSGILAFISDSIIGTENSFSLIMRRID